MTSPWDRFQPPMDNEEYPPCRECGFTNCAEPCDTLKQLLEQKGEQDQKDSDEQYRVWLNANEANDGTMGRRESP